MEQTDEQQATAPNTAAPEASVHDAPATPVTEHNPPTEVAATSDEAEAGAHTPAPASPTLEAEPVEAAAPSAAPEPVAAVAPFPELELPAVDDPEADTPVVVADAPVAADAPAAEAPAVAAPPPPKPKKVEDPAVVAARRERAQQNWDRVVKAREDGEALTGTVTASVKGGLLVDVGGIRGFLPASQARVPIGTAIEALVKTKVPLKVIDIDEKRRRVVVSQRRAVDEERRNKRADLLKSLEIGKTVEGTVVRLAEFGAFVDLGGIDGLIPMRELDFDRVEKVQDVLKVGDVLPVQVLRIEEGGKKISLSRKNALPDPLRDHAELLKPGKTIEGKVVSKDPRLTVEIAPGVTGTIRDSDANPADYEIGESVEVMVRFVDKRTRRISLTTLHGAAAVPPPSSSTGFAPLGVELQTRKR